MKKYIKIFITCFLDIVAIIGAFFSINDKSISFKIIVALSIVLISAIIVIVCCYYNLNKTEKNMKAKKEQCENLKKQYEEKTEILNNKIHDIEGNRNSLKKQYLAKKRKVDIYEFYWARINDIFKLSHTCSAEERILYMYKLYVMFSEELNKEK